jgi:hypothetical protein
MRTSVVATRRVGAFLGLFLMCGSFSVSLTACPSDSSSSEAWDCKIGSRSFPPETLSVPAGCNVRWNEDAGVWCSYC